MYTTIQNKNLQVVFFSILLLQAGIIIFLAPHILPDKYFYDAITIRKQYTQLQNSSFEFFDSYANTARFYRFFGIDQLNSSLLEGCFAYSIVFISLFFTFKFTNTQINKQIAMFIFIWNVPVSIYLGQLSKDAIAFLFMGLITFLVIKSEKLTLFKILLLIVIYALFFRSYWFTYGVFVLINYSILLNGYKIFKSQTLKIMCYIVGILALFITSNIFGTALTDSRTSVNMFREGSVDANTLISNYMPNSNFLTDMINWMVAFITIVFPISLVPRMNILSLAFTLWNIFNIYFLFRVFRNTITYNLNDRDIKKIKLIFTLIISFTFTQALFEPDLGSFLRHQLIQLPPSFYLLLTCYKGYRKKFNAKFF
ncbi:hypothetical protein KM918_03800 [Priestia megaterium]|uniref:hypothetical protein n=1 Tax=Priestia megaterium TaxID=1404 RepID=UPI001C23E242|nr:hypothetical protein [Priestia megaterium]MBU8686476.1 hypothetical protein [Priestia megaterium]